MLTDDLRAIEDKHMIFIRQMVLVNTYYHIFKEDGEHVWVLSAYPFEKMDMKPAHVEDIVFPGLDQQALSAYVVNNHVLVIQTLTGYRYFNQQILCTMGDVFQFSAQANYDVSLSQKIVEDLVNKCIGYYDLNELKTHKQRKRAMEHTAFALFYRYVMLGIEKCDATESIINAYPHAYQKLKEHLESSSDITIARSDVEHYALAFTNRNCP